LFSKLLNNKLTNVALAGSPTRQAANIQSNKTAVYHAGMSLKSPAAYFQVKLASKCKQRQLQNDRAKPRHDHYLAARIYFGIMQIKKAAKSCGFGRPGKLKVGKSTANMLAGKCRQKSAVRSHTAAHHHAVAHSAVATHTCSGGTWLGLQVKMGSFNRKEVGLHGIMSLQFF